MRKTLKRGGGNLNKQIDLGKNAFVINPTYSKSVAKWPAWNGTLQSLPGPSCKGNYFKYNNTPKLSYPKYVGGKSKRRHTRHKRRHTRHKRRHTRHKRRHTRHKRHNIKSQRKHTKKNKKNKRYKGGARWSWVFPFNSMEQGLYYNSKRLYNSFFGKTTANIGKTNLDPNYQPNLFQYN